MDKKTRENVLDEQLELALMMDILEDEYNDETLNQNEHLKTEKATKSKKKQKSLKKRLADSLKVKTVIILLITLIVNTYAWFIYISRISTTMQMHIRSWDFELTDGSQSDQIIFAVDEIFPGMDKSTKEISARNNGETTADFTCDVYYLKVLDEVYTTNPNYLADGETAIKTDCTTDELLDMMRNSYPFKMNVLINDAEYTDAIQLSTGEQVNVTLQIEWPYQTGETENEIEENDEIDTAWGTNAYEYYNTKTSDDIIYSVIVKAYLTANQHHDT